MPVHIARKWTARSRPTATSHDRFRAVLTHNRSDFIRLHRENSEHEGIIVCTDNPNFEELARKVNAALEGMDSLRGKLVRVNRGN